MKKIVAAVAALALVLPVSAHAATSYDNCTALHRDYPHGVARAGARDQVRGSTRPVTNFTRSTKTYNANRGLDRDHDGVACEKR